MLTPQTTPETKWVIILKEVHVMSEANHALTKFVECTEQLKFTRGDLADVERELRAYADKLRELGEIEVNSDKRHNFSKYLMYLSRNGSRFGKWCDHNWESIGEGQGTTLRQGEGDSGRCGREQRYQDNLPTRHLNHLGSNFTCTICYPSIYLFMFNFIFLDCFK